MKNIDERIEDWEKLKREADKVRETTGEIRKVHQANFYAGLKMFYEKYGSKFDYNNKPR